MQGVQGNFSLLNVYEKISLRTIIQIVPFKLKYFQAFNSFGYTGSGE